LAESAVSCVDCELDVLLLHEAVLQELYLIVQNKVHLFESFDLLLVIVHQVALLGRAGPAFVSHDILLVTAVPVTAVHPAWLSVLPAATTRQFRKRLHEPFRLEFVLVALDRQLLDVREIADSLDLLQLLLRRLKLLLQLVILPLYARYHVRASPEHLLLVLHVELGGVFAGFALSYSRYYLLSLKLSL